MCGHNRDFSWLGRSLGSDEEPRLRHVCDFWTVRGPSNRDLTCAAFQVESGLELRTSYGGEMGLVASQLFRGPDADERLAETADNWRRTLLAKGFREMAR